MSRNPRSTRSLLFGGILILVVLGFATVSATVAGVSLSAVILVLVAFAEAGLIILGLTMLQNGREATISNDESASLPT